MGSVERVSISLINIYLLVYIFGVVLKKIMNFPDGGLDILLWSGMIVPLLFKPNLTYRAMCNIVKEDPFKIFIIFFIVFYSLIIHQL